MNMHSNFRADDAASFDAAEPGFVRRYRYWIAAGVIVLLALLAVVMMRVSGKDDVVVAPSAPSVTVLVPGRVEVSDFVTATGSISARREMPVGVQGEGGMVTAVLVDAGQYVRAGQVLARVDRTVQTAQAAQMRASAQSAQADARLAQVELDRAQTLVSKGFVSAADIDRRTATRDSARARAAASAAQASEMAARLARLDIRAPAAGLVLDRAVEPGQIVSGGSMPLFRIAKDGEFELQAKVAEQDIARLKIGIPAKVTPVGSRTAITGKIWLLEPSIDAQTRQGMARIALPWNDTLRSGGFAAARITAGQALRPVLPQSAVQSDTKGAYVFIVGSGDKVTRRDITIGEVGEFGIAVAAGLSGTERVVMSAAAFLNPGEKVRPIMKRSR